MYMGDYVFDFIKPLLACCIQCHSNSLQLRMSFQKFCNVVCLNEYIFLCVKLKARLDSAACTMHMQPLEVPLFLCGPVTDLCSGVSKKIVHLAKYIPEDKGSLQLPQ